MLSRHVFAVLLVLDLLTPLSLMCTQKCAYFLWGKDWLWSHFHYPCTSLVLSQQCGCFSDILRDEDAVLRKITQQNGVVLFVRLFVPEDQ